VNDPDDVVGVALSVTQELRVALRTANAALVSIAKGQQPVCPEREWSEAAPSAKGRGYSAVGLFNPKLTLNVGSALRSAGCFGVALVAIQGRRAVRAPTDTGKAWRHMPVQLVDGLREAIPYDCTPVAIEVTKDARSLSTFTHPERAFYVFGPEDGSLPPSVLAWCKHVVRIPAGCLNLGVAVAVTLYDREAKS
jgi:tRNA(Leu) C34 or U34 (ribose-2'-O)-methylase TrmL